MPKLIVRYCSIGIFCKVIHDCNNIPRLRKLESQIKIRALSWNMLNFSACLGLMRNNAKQTNKTATMADRFVWFFCASIDEPVVLTSLKCCLRLAFWANLAFFHFNFKDYHGFWKFKMKIQKSKGLKLKLRYVCRSIGLEWTNRINTQSYLTRIKNRCKIWKCIHRIT